ncbi:acyl-CoA dehydrogenase family protein [Microbacterium sp. zg.Y625]|uniref:acyl-CoA dehydrogenase family protein n=1 Tax=Microbacterium jiangjiandongii TaxID=3049071 RepID=UPI00214CB9CF|nr:MULTISPECIES: acyl-CoA dehydrogenase family protein [unclassified Microbacterium]MCR2793458.1 acyl-CoA dehydrogenase family protein [Microbacterium sp. zg.Y625]MCR2815364.1 acyl-CoA dehydrogenase family protein [Microbacterium sp. zg.Y843]WIM25171.1 acyl-CoA dehydrogenase family protein [Microbacterium sp. zg-Y625]
MTLDYGEPSNVTALRAELQDLVSQHIPAGFLGAFTRDPADLAVTERFSRELGARRLLTLAWPTEHGGRSADVLSQTAMREEMWAAHEPRGAQYMGLNWVGPVIMRHGTAQQRAEHLPRIASGEVIWCQGFSEPGAGSDLPALRTRATRVEGGWRISGQKVWTSYASMAQWCFLLARTGNAADRKQGITVFLLDMDQPGVEVRPISAMLGPHHLNEVYFDEAWVPEDAVLGDVDGGWGVVMDVLSFERIGIARYARCESLLRAAPDALGAAWEKLPASLRERWAAVMVRTRQVRLLAYRLLLTAQADAPPIGDTALYRVAVTSLDQEVAEVLMEIVENAGLGTSDPDAAFAREVEDHWRYAQASTVASGTLEINKNAAARQLVRP